ncbi:hypothetical protein KUL49_10010 [Alteromonas sp. KUL49]|nr:hypothetical protein KUL49_10010 [Alteromonas sp. KUL49]
MHTLQLKLAIVTFLWTLLAWENVANARAIQNVASETNTSWEVSSSKANINNVSITLTERRNDITLTPRLSVSEPKSITIFVLALTILALRRVPKAQIKTH